MARASNVFGEPLQGCCQKPVTGFYRNGYCETGPEDAGMHLVCAEMTEEFLEFSVSRGNDLVTPHPEWQFPGLKAGDCWCLCVLRWKEALEAGCAPRVKLAATHISTLEFVDLKDLKAHALDDQGNDDQGDDE
ncbi:MAG: DUF2237 domain-containing protein [Planctomycetota bacterium]|nr:DUF2237 domain-containing protein [Planctomycetota bacterium]